jgi:hypothetical protein
MRFYTCGLLSKWGFDDGDLLIGLLLDNDFGLENDKQVLAEVVMRHVIPAIDQSIELKKVADWNWTGHNPIRAEKVNGVDVDDYGNRSNPTITPEFVDIDDNAILAVAREVDAIKT